MSQENVELVRNLYGTWNVGNDGLDLCVPDVEWDVSRWAPDLPEPARGQDEVRTLVARLIGMWDALRFEPERVIEAGDDSVVVVYTMHGRGKSSGATVATRHAHVFTVRNDLIARCVLYPDVAEALEAVGLSESESLKGE